MSRPETDLPRSGDSEQALQETLAELGSAEAFLDYFGVEYEPRCVQVNRLHILQRYHDYLASNPLAEGASAAEHYGYWLKRAYLDFVSSSAREQKALRVYRRHEPGFVSLDQFEAGGEN
ncbi:nitrogenase-stabilizing/protective protein NifW [Aestuariirhabdus litorea]|uniref:Nitrogenase-stabilizing/protective protein NifW n=1 Tax=Aestuariirhabdus litorea TaxID=2528527 RepID=A0A3P3VKV9_9GAMM|nr:nitrogenase-stabilizing/protective protein NifW [Aestuariirhabdus litorea]RRJ82947.1 nitrogen fixation protein NifW [Aestuariirhabdus litorea]RWW93106.1 nitrogen fixation protein NifW [Endozoicomonadaceae bacterium GTF-13]